MILFILALSAFLGDFGSGAGIPCIIPQGEEWGMRYLSPSLLFVSSLQELAGEATVGLTAQE